MEPAVAPSLAAHGVYARYIEAMGGRAALEQYTSTHVVGQFLMPSQGIDGDLEVFAAAPNRIAIRVDIPGFGTVNNGFNGEVGWTINPAVGSSVLEGRALNQMRQEADFLGPLNVEAYVDTAEVVEDTEFEGKMCHKVRVVTRWGEEYVEFYDVASGLLMGGIRAQESPMGPMETTTVLSDYQEFGGIMIPTRMVQRTAGVEQVITVSAVDYDTVDPAVFAVPEEIERLLKKQ
jgi:hypothetical protein